MTFYKVRLNGHLKQLIAHRNDSELFVLFSFLSIGLGQVFGFVFTKIFSIILPTHLFGIYASYWITIKFISALSLTETNTGLYRYSIEDKYQNRLDTSLIFTTIIHVFVLSIILMITIVVLEQLGYDIIENSIFYIILGGLGLAINAILESLAASLKSSLNLFAVVVLPILIKPLIAVFFYYTFHTLESVFIAIILTYIVCDALLIFIITKPFELTYPSFNMWIKLLKYGGPVFLYSGLYVTLSFIFQLIINEKLNEYYVGIYLILFSIVTLIKAVDRAIRATVDTEIISLYEQQKFEEIQNYIYTSTKMIFSLFFPIILIFYLIPEFFIILLSSREYLLGIVAIYPMIASGFLIPLQKPFGVGIHVIKRPNLTIIPGILSFLLSIAILYFLIDPLGFAAVGFAMLAYHLIFTVLIVIVSGIHFPLLLNRNFLLCIIFITSLCVTVVSLTYVLKLNLIFKITFVIAYFLLLKIFNLSSYKLVLQKGKKMVSMITS